MKPGRTLPSDDIDGYSLKLIAPILLPAILHIVNLSIVSGTFAKVWKEQMIHPHFKKSDRELLDNYRPVSGIVQLGMLTETIVHEQFVGHFHTHHLFHENHHGSLAHHDTTTALLQVNSYCFEAAEKKELAATLFVDQSSAFDLIDHNILLAKLKAYSLSPIAIKWFASYLQDRSFRVQIEARRSNPVVLGHTEYHKAASWVVRCSL